MKLLRKSNDQIMAKLANLCIKASKYAIYEDGSIDYMCAPDIVWHTAKGARIMRRVYRVADQYKL